MLPIHFLCGFLSDMDYMPMEKEIVQYMKVKKGEDLISSLSNQNNQMDRRIGRDNVESGIGDPAQNGHAEGDHQPQRHPQEGSGGVLCLGDHAAGRAIIPVHFMGIKRHKNSSFPKWKPAPALCPALEVIISDQGEKINRSPLFFH